MKERSIRLWDLPIRLFHWVLALAVAAAFATGLAGGNWMTWHGRLGIAIVGLLSFRLLWGLVGSTYARFAQFVPGPSALSAYLRGDWQGVGHNPLGALSVLTLLGLLSFQVLSGLFANDDIAFAGPLQDLVAKGTSDWLTGMHRQVIWILGGLIALHIAAVLFHSYVRKDDLLSPMVGGRKTVAVLGARDAASGGWLALIAALGLATLAMWIAGGGLLPVPTPVAAPTW
jgi:cytochrome b